MQKGDVVAILLPNCPEFAISALGILEAGLVLTTLNPIYTPGKSKYTTHKTSRYRVKLGNINHLEETK